MSNNELLRQAADALRAARAALDDTRGPQYRELTAGEAVAAGDVYRWNDKWNPIKHVIGTPYVDASWHWPGGVWRLRV